MSQPPLTHDIIILTTVCPLRRVEDSVSHKTGQEIIVPWNMIQPHKGRTLCTVNKPDTEGQIPSDPLLGGPYRSPIHRDRTWVVGTRGWGKMGS